MYYQSLGSTLYSTLYYALVELGSSHTTPGAPLYLAFPVLSHWASITKTTQTLDILSPTTQTTQTIIVTNSIISITDCY